MQTRISTIISTVLFALVAQTGFAYDFYVGGTIGLGALDSEFKHHNETSGEHHFAQIGSTSFIGGGLLGVENVYCDNFYTALEFNVRYDSLNEHIYRSTNATGGNAFTVKLKNDIQYGLDLKLGAPVELGCGCQCFQTIPYFLVGVQAGEFSGHIHNNTATAFRGLPAFGHLNVSDTRVGPKLGFGVRWNWWSCVTVDFQYNFVWYGKVSRSAVDTGTTTPGTWRHHLKLDQHSVLLSFSVPFDGLFGSWFGGCKDDCCSW